MYAHPIHDTACVLCVCICVCSYMWCVCVCVFVCVCVCLCRAPDDKAIAKELLALKQTMKAERAAQAKLYKGQFKFPDVKAKTDQPDADSDAKGGGGDTGLRQRKGAAGGEGRTEGASEGAGQRQGAAGARGWLSWLLGLVLLILTVLGGWFLRGGL